MDEKIARRLSLFPLSAQIAPDLQGGEEFTIASLSLEALAEQYGTPLYLYDQATLESALSEYRRSLERYYPGEAGITYAGKAFLCTAMAQWVSAQGLMLDCTGVGELHIAEAACVPRRQVLVHGVNKSDEDLQAAVRLAGTIVVDNLGELERLVGLHQSGIQPFPEIWLRLRPGMAVDTHAYTQTGQQDSKFGMDFVGGSQALQLCLSAKLPLTGLHFHLGSHFHELTPLRAALAAVVDFSVAALSQQGWAPQVLCAGGGWGVPYHEDDLPHPSIASYVQYLGSNLQELCKQRSLPLPRLQVEPGRSLVARAGVALNPVGAENQTPNRRWLV